MFFEWLNYKSYSITRSPQDILALAMSEANQWEQVWQAEVEQDHGTISLPHQGIVGAKCFVDGSWKGTEDYSGVGWVCQLPDSSQWRGCRNLCRSSSPLHTELEALIWAMENMLIKGNHEVTFLTDSQELVKMTESPSASPAFSIYLEVLAELRSRFGTCRIRWISREENEEADRLARLARSRHYDYISVTTSSGLVI